MAQEATEAAESDAPIEEAAPPVEPDPEPATVDMGEDGSDNDITVPVADPLPPPYQTTASDDEWWGKSPEERAKPPRDPNLRRAQFLVSYAFLPGGMFGAGLGQAASVGTIKHGGRLDALVALKPGKPEFLGLQFRGGAYHGSGGTSPYVGGLFEGGGWLGASKQVLLTAGGGAEWSDGIGLFVAEVRGGATVGPLFLGLGVDFEVSEYSGVLIFGVQVGPHIGLAANVF
jgi:hypothetical protein